jgi:HAD superfamily hydrolase (TIGR01509 family)
VPEDVTERREDGLSSRGTGGPRPFPDDVGAVVFDWDGTLVDSHDALESALAATTAEMMGEALPSTASDRAMVLELGEVHSLRLVSQDPHLLERLHRRFRERYQAQRPTATLRSGAAYLLRLLRDRGIRTAVLSGGDDRRVREELDRFGLLDLVDLVVTGESLPATLPSPAPLHHMLDLLQLPPEKVVFVGDSATDVIGGRAAGVHVVVLRREQNHDAAGTEGPSVVIDTLHALGYMLAPPR